jgi:hypothetical protein
MVQKELRWLGEVNEYGSESMGPAIRRFYLASSGILFERTSKIDDRDLGWVLQGSL